MQTEHKLTMGEVRSALEHWLRDIGRLDSCQETEINCFDASADCDISGIRITILQDPITDD